MERMSPRQHESSILIKSKSESRMVAMNTCLSMMLGKRRSGNISVMAEVHFPSILTERSSLSWKKRGRKVAKPVSNKGLKAMALQIAGGLGLPAFGAGECWLSRWKQTCGIGYRCFTNTAQRVPKDYEEMFLQFRKAIIMIRKDKGILTSRIVKMDQTMCPFDIVFETVC